jgi:hypothetical protein
VGGYVAYVPEGCPDNCLNHGTCSTNGTCVCNKKYFGANCGGVAGKSALTSGAKAGIAGGALAGVIIGAVCLGCIVFAFVTYGGYKGIDWLARDSFANNQMHDSPLYEESGNKGNSPLYEHPDSPRHSPR